MRQEARVQFLVDRVVRIGVLSAEVVELRVGGERVVGGCDRYTGQLCVVDRVARGVVGEERWRWGGGRGEGQEGRGGPLCTVLGHGVVAGGRQTAWRVSEWE